MNTLFSKDIGPECRTFKTHKLNLKILDLTQNRDEAIINLIIIHSNNCKFENINSSENTIKFIGRLFDKNKEKK